MRKALWPLFLLILFGFGLRVWHLGAASLWYDEGFSFHLARLPLTRAFAWELMNVNTPLYYFLLHFWIRLAGFTEFSLRFPSVLFGTLLIALMYRLGRSLWDGRGGVLAAFFACVAPVLIWPSREARMYIPWVFFCLLGSWGIWETINSAPHNRLPWAVLAVLADLAALYTHAFASFLVLGHVALLATVAVRDREWSKPLALVSAAIIVPFLPWAAMAIPSYRANAGYFPGTLPPHTVFLSTVVTAFFGRELSGPLAWAGAGLGLALLSAGCWAFRRRRWLMPYLASYLLLPLAAMTVALYRTPKFSPRYVTFVAPAFLLGMAGGVVAGLRTRGVARWGTLMAITAMLALMGKGTLQLHLSPAHPHEDFRSAASYVRAHILPDETVLLVSGHFFPVWEYYYGPQGWHPVPPIPILNLKRILGSDVALQLDRALRGKGGVWVVRWQDEAIDPNDVVGIMLGLRGQKEREVRFQGLRVEHYRLFPAPFAVLSEPTWRLDIDFGHLLRLKGYRSVGEHIILYWEALRKPRREYKVSLSLWDERGVLWERRDGCPLSCAYPTTRWEPGKVVLGLHRLPLSPGIPPGPYRLRLILYEARSLEGVDIIDHMGAPRGREVEIEVMLKRRWTLEQLPSLSHWAEVEMAPGIWLKGVEGTSGTVAPGGFAQFSLYWFAAEAPAVNYQLRLGFVETSGKEVGPIQLLPLSHPHHPASRWQRGELVRGEVRVRVPLEASSGTIIPVVALTDERGRIQGPLYPLPELRVKAVAHQFELPQITRTVNAHFDPGILVGADWAPEVRSGQTLTVTLVWRAKKATEKAYTVFVHLLNPEGRWVAGHDSPPGLGLRPTTGWVPEEVIIDPHFLPLSLPPGRYLLEVGLYDASTPSFPRLRVVGTGEERIILGQVEILPPR